MNQPKTKRKYLSLTNYNDKFVFLAGGLYSGVSSSVVEYYSIEKNLWYSAPNLNQKRHSHYSCQLGDKIYVFGGRVDDKNWLNSVEILDATALIRGERVSWTLIQPSQKSFTPRTRPLVTAISPH